MTFITDMQFAAAPVTFEHTCYGGEDRVSYQRVVDARVPAGLDAAERIRKIRLDHWLFFY